MFEFCEVVFICESALLTTMQESNYLRKNKLFSLFFFKLIKNLKI